MQNLELNVKSAKEMWMIGPEHSWRKATECMLQLAAQRQTDRLPLVSVWERRSVDIRQERLLRSADHCVLHVRE